MAQTGLMENRLKDRSNALNTLPASMMEIILDHSRNPTAWSTTINLRSAWTRWQHGWSASRGSSQKSLRQHFPTDSQWPFGAVHSTQVSGSQVPKVLTARRFC